MGPITERAERFVRSVFKVPQAAQTPTLPGKAKKKIDWEQINKKRAKARDNRRGY